jgi:hypothetical protein
MAGETADLKHIVARRILCLQLGLILGVASLLIVINAFQVTRFGFDLWLALFAGSMGSSIALLRRVRSDAAALQEVGHSLFDTLVPVVYGAILAGLTYLLFMSGILSGAGEEGLLTTNLFPTFQFPEVGTRSLIEAFLASQPASVPDLGKLLVWSFLAGYSENFVIGILGQLYSRANRVEEQPTA